jgi:hypothetical protein
MALGCVSCSPHLISLRERISVDCAAITHQEFDALVDENWEVLAKVNEEFGGTLTHFEAVTGLAFKYFSQQHVRRPLALDAEICVLSNANFFVSKIINELVVHYCALLDKLPTFQEAPPWSCVRTRCN